MNKILFPFAVLLAAAVLITGCSVPPDSEPRAAKPTEPTELVQLASPPDSTQYEALPFSAQILRTDGYQEDARCPQIRILHAPEDLWDYYQENRILYNLDTDFRDAITAYDTEFFRENALLLVTLEESSGSVRHEVAGVTVGPDGPVLSLNRIVPETGDCAMAQWHILVGVPAARVSDSAKLTFTTIRPDPPQIIGISRSQAVGTQLPLWGILLTVRDISPTGLTPVCIRTDDSFHGDPLRGGSPAPVDDAIYADTASYTLEKLEDREWKEIHGRIADPPALQDLQPYGVAQWSASWDDALPQGQYRIGWELYRGTETETFYAGFEILAVTDGSQITIEAENAAISLPWLPGWEYELVYPAEGCVSWGINYRPCGTDGWVRYHCFPVFGVCGTGLATEPYNGGSMGTYDGREIWDFIAFPTGDSKARFVAVTEQVDDWWPEHGGTAMEILDRAQTIWSTD